MLSYKLINIVSYAECIDTSFSFKVLEWNGSRANSSYSSFCLEIENVGLKYLDEN